MFTLKTLRLVAVFIVTAVAITIILTPRENAAFYLLPLIFALCGLVIGARIRRPIVCAMVGFLVVTTYILSLPIAESIRSGFPLLNQPTPIDKMYSDWWLGFTISRLGWMEWSLAYWWEFSINFPFVAGLILAIAIAVLLVSAIVADRSLGSYVLQSFGESGGERSPTGASTRRFQFSVRLLLVMSLMVACVTAFLVSYGPTILWATDHVHVRKFAALREYDLVARESDEEIIHCRFAELRFSLPKTLWQNRRLFRAAGNSLWLAFEDQVRQISIPLSTLASKASPVFSAPQVPFALKSQSTPKLIKTALAASTSDFSINITRERLSVLDWALKQRPLLGFDDQSMVQFAVRSTPASDLILVDAEPSKIDSRKRIRSLIYWEANDRSHSGQVWLGDATQEHVNWIEAFALSFDFVASETSPKLTDLMSGSISDDQVLEMLQVDATKLR